MPKKSEAQELIEYVQNVEQEYNAYARLSNDRTATMNKAITLRNLLTEKKESLSFKKKSPTIQQALSEADRVYTHITQILLK